MAAVNSCTKTSVWSTGSVATHADHLVGRVERVLVLDGRPQVADRVATGARRGLLALERARGTGKKEVSGSQPLTAPGMRGFVASVAGMTNDGDTKVEVVSL
jgi:hypothetical protein